MRGADAFEDDDKYLSVRRLVLMIEGALYRGTQWAVFEPNDEALWSALRLQAGSFLRDLKRQGAFSYYSVRCDATTTPPADVERGVVNILVNIAPTKSDELVTIQVQQPVGSAA